MNTKYESGDNMTEAMGKHLLVDCYGCRSELIDNFPNLHAAIEKAIYNTQMDVSDTHVHQSEDALVVSAIGIGNQICIHAYPTFHYVAIDVFTFNTDIDPTSMMQIFRSAFRPDKVRATSIKRGKIDTSQDMKPKTKSKTTTMRKVKSTGQQLKKTGGKMWQVIRNKKLNTHIDDD